LYAPRLDACLAALDHLHAQQTHDWMEVSFFPYAARGSHCGVLRCRNKAESHLADGMAFFPNGGGERFLRLPYCALNPAEIDEGIRRLADTVHEK
jgi:hypothetical protein